MKADQVLKEGLAPDSEKLLQALAKKSAPWLMALLVVYVVARSVVAAATKTFWFDELLTVTVSSLPGMKAVMAALTRTVDGQPPAFYLVERFTLGLLRNKEIGLRLPSIFATPCTMICIFVYVRKRGGEAIAFLCTLLLLSTVVFTRYAVEARPYSMLMACLAFAMVCYQRLPSLFWTTMLGTSVVAAGALHYLGVFILVPFGLAEAVFFLRTQRCRWGVWLPMVCGCVPLLVFWRLLSNMRTAYGEHYYTNAGFMNLPATYGGFFLTDSGYGAAIAVVAVAGVLAALLWTLPGAPISSEVRNANAVQAALLVSAVGLPFFVTFGIKLMHGGMRDTYALGAAIGICLAAGCALSLARPVVVMLFAIFLFCNVGIREYIFWRSNHSLHLTPGSSKIEQFIDDAGRADQPVVFTSGMRYMPIAYYASPDFFKRLYYLADAKRQFEYQGADTFDKQAVLLREYLPLQVRDFGEFTASHRSFLLYAEEPEDQGTWLIVYLSRGAASVQLIKEEQNRRLYFVMLNDEFGRNLAMPKP